METLIKTNDYLKIFENLTKDLLFTSPVGDIKAYAGPKNNALVQKKKIEWLPLITWNSPETKISKYWPTWWVRLRGSSWKVHDSLWSPQKSCDCLWPPKMAPNVTISMTTFAMDPLKFSCCKGFNRTRGSTIYHKNLLEPKLKIDCPIGSHRLHLGLPKTLWFLISYIIIFFIKSGDCGGPLIKP